MVFAERLAQARQMALARWVPLAAPYPACTLFFSISDGSARARVVHATARDFGSAWRAGAAALRQLMAARRMKGKWLRVDWVVHAEPVSRAELDVRLRGCRRNYHRDGLAFDARLKLALTEQELNAQAALYAGPDIPHAALNDANLLACAQDRFGESAWPATPEGDWHAFRTAGVFADTTGVHALSDEPLAYGRREVNDLDDTRLTALITSSSEFLARQVSRTGRFAYGYFPCFDRKIPTYNTLRHASTVYAMLEAWALTRSPTLGKAIERALDYIEREWVKVVATDADGPVAMVLDQGDEIKLGASAVLILAITRQAADTGDTRRIALAESLARGIRRMQDPATGRFVHVLNYPDLSLKDEHRIIYYDGEAAFALTRLYQATGNSQWLDIVERAFEHFIAAEHWRAHDHWLSYCVNELTLVRPRRAYYELGVRNVKDYLGFVMDRMTTFPTLLELMMAARAMLERIASEPSLADLYAEVDIPAFEVALEHRAHRFLDGFFWPELAMHMQNPDRIVGSFFMRHHAFRVRIDDIEHYLSGLIAYLAHVRHGRPALPTQGATTAPAASPDLADAAWTPAEVAAATQGHWLRPPASAWRAAGVCVWAPTLLPGELIAIRAEGGEIGVPPGRARSLAGSAWLVDNATLLPQDPATPVLLVPHVRNAVIALGHAARARLTVPVLAVTGSAGKTTTVAMLARALALAGPVGQTRHNANLPAGIAWNLASMPLSARHIVLETAIGRMRESTRMARPDLAIFTTIAPAHLEFHQDLRTIATRKARIFEGMVPDATAILNEDMPEFETVLVAAQARGLRILRYGTGPKAHARLLAYDADSQLMQAEVAGNVLAIRMSAGGRHLAMNALAVLAAAHALGLALPAVAQALAGFTTLPGRGECFNAAVDGRIITVVDESFNANPGSMSAALDAARDHPAQAKLLILGDMLELGAHAADLHLGLKDAILDARPQRVILCGPLMQPLARALTPVSAIWYPDADAVIAHLPQHLGDVDYVLVKSSGGTRLSAVVGALRAPGSPAPGVDQNRTVSPA